MSSPEPGVLVIVSAPSGGGKSTLTRTYVEASRGGPHPAELSISYTTRAPRPGEVDGVHYHFVDDARFRAMIDDGAFLEYAEVFGRFYGTGRDVTAAELAAGRDVILDIDWQGARQVRQAVPEAVGVFILPPSRDELEARLRARAQDDEATIALRMAEATSEMQHCHEYDYLIINDDLAAAHADFAAVVRAARSRNAVVRRHQAGRIDALLADYGASG